MEKLELEFRKPNLVEVYEFLDAVNGLSGSSPLKMKGDIIKFIGKFVNWQKCGYENYESLLEDTSERGLELANLADKFYKEVLEVFSKKN